ncbi:MULTISPECIES: hypothetical protein [unclassified Nocardiopsis]|uniref:hypothetical protein n=1 Tax=unclassified Nocardiopsis TaxID=2649073 RepID=UPI00135C9BCC|nr:MULTISPECIES: hypothetical protein [unclassified Nocardiopsis]
MEEALAAAEPARAVRLAREVEHTRPPHVPLAEEDRTAWIERALKELDQTADTLPGWSAEDPDSGEDEFTRVLIQVVALLEGASTVTVVHHAQALAEHWGVAPMRPTPVSGDGFTGRLRGIGAGAREDRVRFHRSGHGAAALDHLWREHSDARGSFQEWAHAAAPALSRRERAGVARHWVALALRHRDPAPVETLLYRWSSPPALK